MSQPEGVRALFQEALNRESDRRSVLQGAAALGVSAPVSAALARAAVQPAAAKEAGTLEVTYYDWILSLHPSIETVNADFNATFPISAQVAPSQGFGIERFVTEARDQTSTWDMYFGVTPFLEMIQLVDSGVIEPWDPYLPADVLDSLIPAIREEATYDGQLYVWPFLVDVIVQGWNASLVEAAGLDPEVAPVTWDDFINNAQAVVDSGAAPFGLTFDFHAWRSLIPITHSISTDVYAPDTGLFVWNSEPAIEALEIMKRMMPLANPDVLNEGQADAGVAQTPDEQAFASQAAAYYIKFQGSHLRTAAAWPDPAALRFGALPKTADGVGGTVFWTTGGVLLTHGEDKEQAAAYANRLTRDQGLWERAMTGNPPQESPNGQLSVYQSIWNEYESDRPAWLPDWAFAIYDGLGTASAIHPTRLSITQFNVAAPFYVAYLAGEESDAKSAMDNAMAAVEAEYAALGPAASPTA